MSNTEYSQELVARAALTPDDESLPAVVAAQHPAEAASPLSDRPMVDTSEVQS